MRLKPSDLPHPKMTTFAKLVVELNRLPDRLFARCHGSYAVGFKHVRLLKRDSLVVQGDAEIPLSRRYARAFRSQYLVWV